MAEDILVEFSRHTIHWCFHCERWMVVCGACRNNTCNAGRGIYKGEPCPYCKSASSTEGRIRGLLKDGLKRDGPRPK